MKFLTHYYRTGDPPLRSLSALADSEALKIASEFKNETALVYRRFKKYELYWLERRETERWLRNEFIKKGGQPNEEYPQYKEFVSRFWFRFPKPICFVGEELGKNFISPNSQFLTNQV